MRRLTTPRHEFILDVDPRLWDEFRVTYKQAGKIVLEKCETDSGIRMETINTDSETTYKLWFQLTQEETQQFKPGIKTEVQIRCHYSNGNAYASEIIPLKVSDVLNQEILGDED